MGRVLLIDADRNLTRQARRRIEGRGHRCRVASSLASARRMLQSETPDLVILAASLPDGPGLPFFGELADSTPDLPVILTFDEQDAHLSATALASGAFDAFLKAPPTARRLAGRVDATLGGLTTEEEKTSAVRELAEANAVLRAHLDTTSGGVLVFNNDRRVVSFNRRFLELWDVPLSMAEGGDAKTLLSTIFGSAEDVQAAQASAMKVLDDPELVLEDQRLEFENGKVISWSTHPVRLDDGTVIGRAIDFRDLTAQIATEEQVNLQATLLDQIPTAVAATRTDGTIRYWNRFAEQLHGWTSAEVMDSDIRTVVFRKGDGTVRAALRALRINGGWQGEVELQRKDGSTFPALLSLTYSPGFGGREGMVLGVMVDLTERRSLEAKLFQAQKMEAVGTLAGGLAHDFNNLLTGVLGGANLARADAEPGSTTDEVMGTIERAALRGRDLCSQLLSFSRAERAEITTVNPVNSITEVVKIVERTFPKEVRINVDLADDLTAMLGDKSKINHALMNLLVNARDAMSERGVITVRASLSTGVPADEIHPAVASDQRYVCLSVEDTGAGMAPDVLARAFEPFFTTKRSGQGTGLGLPMVFSIARAHGGAVRVWTEAGHGARFALFVPASDAKLESRIEAEDVEGRLERYAGDETILIVDDEAIVRSVGTRILKQFGYTPLEAAGGPEALRMLDEHRRNIALILLDIVMPEMDGAEVVSRLREKHVDIPVLLCSGYSVAGIVDGLLGNGAVGFVQKPYQLEELLMKLRAALDARAVGPPPQR